jgi:hypothetical protein
LVSGPAGSRSVCKGLDLKGNPPPSRAAGATSNPARQPQTTSKATRMNKLLVTLILSAFATASFNASAASHAGAPMKAASAPIASASAPAKPKKEVHKKEMHKKEVKAAAPAASK